MALRTRPASKGPHRLARVEFFISEGRQQLPSRQPMAARRGRSLPQRPLGAACAAHRLLEQPWMD